MTPANTSPSGIERLEYDAWGHLVLMMSDGRSFAGVVPVRAFPWTAPVGPLSFIDGHGKEVAYCERSDSLPPAVRMTLASELERREFIPRIERILEAPATVPPCRWKVLTDRGVTSIDIDSDEEIRQIPDHGLVIVDTHGLRFVIRDVRQLDAASRRTLRRFV